MADSRTREQAIEDLRLCGDCGRWIVKAATCDSCWVDRHRCPPTIEQAQAAIQRAIELGREAATIQTRLRAMTQARP